MLLIVDDEESIRDSLAWLAQSRGIASITYDSSASFLSALEKIPTDDPQGKCVLLDVRMPGMNGVALFDLLTARQLTQVLPVIFLTGHGDVPMAVDTLKRGAFDFFEKPFNDNKLMDRVQEAMASSKLAAEGDAARHRLDNLTNRERQVLDLILDGKMNKHIADQLGISLRTVEVHRANVFAKMNVKTAMELAGLLK
ncbi:MAG: response regulator [Pseudomonadota bacterium]